MKNKKLIISILSLSLFFSACTKNKDKTISDVNTKEINTEESLENRNNTKDEDKKTSANEVEKEKGTIDKDQEIETNTEDKKTSKMDSKEGKKVASSKKTKSKKDNDISKKEKEIIREGIEESNRKANKEDDKVVIEVKKSEEEYAPFVGYIVGQQLFLIIILFKLK